MDRILVNPAIEFGKPYIAGTRITVQSVLELLRKGLSFVEIMRDYYPDLQVEDIRACLQYAMAVIEPEAWHHEPNQVDSNTNPIASPKTAETPVEPNQPSSFKLSEVTFDPDATPIWELVAQISAQVPDEEWQTLPTDLARRFDHYQKYRQAQN